MARIRSLHPGLFTDENYAVLSFPARELLKGLWVEADDNGIFEWKPLTLKMRIFPADNVDVPALLEELETSWVRQFQVDGKTYGACKNFCQFQRPKKPKQVYPAPEEIKPYIKYGYKARSSEQDNHDGAENGNGADDNQPQHPTSSPPVPHQFPTGTEKSGQMEDGGGRREEEGGNSELRSGADAPDEISQARDGGKPPWWPDRDRYGRITSDVTEKILFDVGKSVLGRNAGGQIAKLRKLYHGDMRSVTDLLMQADEKSDPKQWIGAVIRKAEIDERTMPKHEIYPDEIYR